jgi:hypothetical protein
MSSEWEAAAVGKQCPCWNLFTNTCIKQLCDQVATENPIWHPDLYATDLSTYMVGVAPRWLWWVLPGSGQSIAVQGEATNGV